MSTIESCISAVLGGRQQLRGGGRVAPISAPNDRFEQLVTIVGFKNNRSSDEEVLHRLHTVKREVASAMSTSHRLQMADLLGWVR